MPNTPEQIKDAADSLKMSIQARMLFGLSDDIEIILAAMEAAEKERDGLQKALSSQCEGTDCVWNERTEALARAERAEAYAAKLEKAGDAMRRSTWIDFRAASFAWDVARKEKP